MYEKVFAASPVLESPTSELSHIEFLEFRVACGLSRKVPRFTQSGLSNPGSSWAAESNAVCIVDFYM